MTESQPINKKLQQLEEYITSLVDSLHRGEIPMGLRPVRSVFDRILVEELPQLQLPPQKFCDLYNDLPNVLDAYAIEVNLNSDSYSQKNAQQIIFDRFNNGTYWIIAIAAKPLHYWLVPNPTRRIDLTRLNSLPFAFDWPDQDYTTKQDTFKLIEPAEVVTLPTSPLSWKLLKRGFINTFLNTDARNHQRAFRSIPTLSSEEIDDIINRLKNEVTESIMAEVLSLNSKVKNVEDVQLKIDNKSAEKFSTLDKEIRGISKAIVDTSSFLEQQNSVNQQLVDQSQKSEKRIDEFSRKIEQLLQEKQQQIDEINIVKSLFNRLSQARIDNDDQTVRKAIQNINAFLEQQNSVNQSISTHIQSVEKRTENNEHKIENLIRVIQHPVESRQILQSSVNVSSNSKNYELDNLVQQYNSNSQQVPKSLWVGAENVSFTDEAVARIRDGNASNITFKLDRKGNFLIISREGYCYLLPNKQRRIISPHMYAFAQVLYRCNGYNENYTYFRLIKPALVTEEFSDCWKLSQQGTLEFI